MTARRPRPTRAVWPQPMVMPVIALQHCKLEQDRRPLDEAGDDLAVELWHRFKAFPGYGEPSARILPHILPREVPVDEGLDPA